MTTWQEEMSCCKIEMSQGYVAGRHCGGRHQGDVCKEFQGFKGVEKLEAEGAVRIATGNAIVKMAGQDEDVSLGLGSAGNGGR